MAVDLSEESKDVDLGAQTSRYRNTRISGGEQTMRGRPETIAHDEI